MKAEPPVLRKLAKSWLVQNLGWCALVEAGARAMLEGAFCFGVLFLTFSPAVVLFGWLGLHTVTWLLLYGGYSRIRVVLGISADVARLARYLERASRRVARQDAFLRTLLRGSAARGELSERSDIDILFVPKPTLRCKLRGVLFLWRLRAESVLERVPLQARWLDYERYVPFNVVGESPVDLRKPDLSVGWPARLAAHGLLISFSGIDGSGKTTVANRLQRALREKGFDTAYFYGHRQAWYARGRRPQLSLAIVFETLWENMGREFEELRRHPGMKFIYDLANLVDYIPVNWRLARLLRPNTVVVTDRYVPDVLAYLKAWGPMHDSVETLLLRMCPEADVSILFEVDPQEALRRKSDWTLARLERFVEKYSVLRRLFAMVAVDAHRTPEQVASEVMGALEDRLGLPRLGLPVAELRMGGISYASDAA